MRILTPFRNRHPAIAVIFGLAFGLSAGMAYIGRGWWCLAYFALNLLMVAVVGVLMWGKGGWDIEHAFVVLWPFALIGLAHTFILARRIPAGFRYRWFSRWYGLVPVFFIMPTVLAFAIRSFLFQPFTIPSGSMEPTLAVGDYLVTSKMAYGYSQFSLPFMRNAFDFEILQSAPKRGDVVILAYPPDNSIDYIKRVIGIPGDKIQIKQGLTYLNDSPLRRERIGLLEKGSSYGPATEYREFLPDGRSYLVIELMDDAAGDNTFQFVVPPGHYFMLGDNRDNSSDSRFTLGYVPRANIFAKAVAVLDRTGANFPFREIE
jgi:signal peptidase I